MPRRLNSRRDSFQLACASQWFLAARGKSRKRTKSTQTLKNKKKEEKRPVAPLTIATAIDCRDLREGMTEQIQTDPLLYLVTRLRPPCRHDDAVCPFGAGSRAITGQRRKLVPGDAVQYTSSLPSVRFSHVDDHDIDLFIFWIDINTSESVLRWRNLL